MLSDNKKGRDWYSNPVALCVRSQFLSLLPPGLRLSASVLCLHQNVPVQIEQSKGNHSEPIHRNVTVASSPPTLISFGVKMFANSLLEEGSRDSFEDSDAFLLQATNEIIEEVEASKAFFEVYEGSIYMHQGKTYRIEDLDLETKIARCKETTVRYYTKVGRSTDGNGR